MSAATLTETRDVEQVTQQRGANSQAGSPWREGLGSESVRYALALVILWFGGIKFTAYEAEGISGFVTHSPFMSWVYSVLSVRGFSTTLGGVEIVIALLIAAGSMSAHSGLVGGILAVGMFATTLSFMITTPGVWEATAGGFPALSVVPGQFLVKDFVLLAASLQVLGNAWSRLQLTR